MSKKKRSNSKKQEAKVSSHHDDDGGCDDVLAPCEDAAAAPVADDGGGSTKQREETAVVQDSDSDGTPTTTAEESNVGKEEETAKADKAPAAEEEEEEEEEQQGEDSVWDLARLADGKETCRMDGCESCAVSVWAESAQPDDVWPICEPCQFQEFGGWPAGFEIPPTTTLEGEEEKKWDLVKILSISDVTGQVPIKCSHDHCTLPACCVYRSNKAMGKWYTCLDCQVNDFDGWPLASELPTTKDGLTKLHIETLARKCSTKPNIKMPDPIGTTASPCTGNDDANDNTNTVITPLPGAIQNGSGGSSNGAQPSITPSPSAAAQQKNGATKKKQPSTTQQQQPSKQALAMHEKWRKQAEEMGGKGARIVVSKPEAKKLIFDLLYEAFRPMNITQIHKELKATVPNPVLKGCLDEMVPDNDNGDAFADSDDEDTSAGKKNKSKNKTTSSDSKDPYQLSFKSGRNANTSLYYVDHSKQKNNGNGLEPHARNELYSALAKSQAEEEALKATFNQMTAETKKLLSEPTNEEAVTLLATEEAELKDLLTKVEAAREHKVNEKTKLQTKRRIDNMAAQWRKRRRICMEFLVAMEENTDGTISAKKCLAGDGQIEVDSDEAVAKATVAYAKKKRSKLGGAFGGNKKRPSVRCGAKKATEAESSAVMASEDFVAVALDTQGNVTRVYVDEKEA